MKYARQALRIGYSSLNILATLVTLFWVTKRIRKAVYMGVALYSIWKYVLVAIIAIVFFAVSPAIAQAQTTWADTPGGPDVGRDNAQWYVCSEANGEEAACRVLDMIQAEEKSTIFGGIVTACNVAAGCDAGSETVSVEQSIVLPQVNYLGFGVEIDAYTMQCTITLEEGTLSSGKDANWQWRDFVAGVTTVPSHSDVLHSNAEIAFEVVLTWTGGAYTWYQSTPDNAHDFMDTGASVVASTTTSRSAVAEWTCQIVDVDTGDIIWVPVEPTPTPCFGVGCFPVTPWAPLDPWVPVSDTEKMPTFELDPPGATTCSMIVPGQSWEIPTGMTETVELGWDEVEFCVTEQSFGITLFGIDIGQALTFFFVLSGVGVLISIIKRA